MIFPTNYNRLLSVIENEKMINRYLKHDHFRSRDSAFYNEIELSHRKQDFW